MNELARIVCGNVPRRPGIVRTELWSTCQEYPSVDPASMCGVASSEMHAPREIPILLPNAQGRSLGTISAIGIDWHREMVDVTEGPLFNPPHGDLYRRFEGGLISFQVLADVRWDDVRDHEESSLVLLLDLDKRKIQRATVEEGEG